MNAYRRSIGKAPLARDEGLEKLAREHNRYTNRHRNAPEGGSERVTHNGFKARTLTATRLIGMESIAENVAGAKIVGPIAPQVMAAWKNSGDHTFNLEADWDATGIDVLVAEDGMVYATQIFTTRKRSHFGNVERFREF